MSRFGGIRAHRLIHDSRDIPTVTLGLGLLRCHVRTHVVTRVVRQPRRLEYSLFANDRTEIYSNVLASFRPVNKNYELVLVCAGSDKARQGINALQPRFPL